MAIDDATINVFGPGGVSVAFPAGTDAATIHEVMMKHFAPADTSMIGGLAQGAANTVRGIGQSIGVAPGGSKDIEQSADKIAGNIERQNYQPARVLQDGALNAGDIPRAVAEQATGAALPIAVGALAKRLLGSRLGLAAGLATAGAEYFGPNVKARAAAEGHDEPTTGDKVIGGATTAAQMAADAIALRRFLPGANPIATVGVRGITDSAKKLATTAAIESASAGGQNAIGQAGATVGTPVGLSIDPNEAASAAITGAATGATLATPRLARDAVNAAKFRDMGGDLALPASAVANRVLAKVKAADDLANVKTAYEATSDTAADVLNELRAARKAVSITSPEADNALSRAANGNALNAGDLQAIGDATQNVPGGALVHDLAKQATVLARLKDKGNFDDRGERFAGGAAERIRKFVTGHPLLSGAVGSAGIVHSAGDIASVIADPTALVHAAALGGVAYGAARGVDRTLGLRSPAQSFAEKFGNPSVPVRPQVATPPVAPVAPRPSIGPTGPRIAPLPTPWGAEPPADVTGTVPRSNVILHEGLAKIVAGIAARQKAQAVAVATMPPRAQQASGPQVTNAPQVPTNIVALLQRIGAAQQPQQQPGQVTPQPLAPVVPAVARPMNLAQTIAKITKASGKTKETAAPEQPNTNGGAGIPIEEVPTPDKLLHTDVSEMDHAIARKATDQFKEATNPPPVVAARYYDSTAQRQARIRDRLMAISGDPRFPSEDVSLGEALDKIRHQRSREAVATHVDDVASTQPKKVAEVIRAYFGPTWARSVWNADKAKRHSAQ
jgi:hypothetical protein